MNNEVSEGGNAEQKSFNFDAKRQHRGQMLASNVLINDDEQGITTLLLVKSKCLSAIATALLHGLKHLYSFLIPLCE